MERLERQEIGDGRWETGEGRKERETGEGRLERLETGETGETEENGETGETGDGRLKILETGDGRQEKGERKQKKIGMRKDKVL